MLGKKRKLVRFGKSSNALLKLKTGFFDNNDELLEKSKKIAAIYSRQPRRKNCKCCGSPLSEVSFTKQDIDYLICRRCGHLNGAQEDTNAFCTAVYTAKGGSAYSTTYFSADKKAFNKRVKDIYLPKAEFLTTSLEKLGFNLRKLSVADFGAGSGCFVAALLRLGFGKVAGFEVSKAQVALANSMIGKLLVFQHKMSDIASLARQTNANIISMIGVLEHLQKPREVLEAIADNPAVKFVYISIPLFSVCVFFEMVFPDVMQRQLSGGHTHLYTDSSINWMCREFGLKRVAEWWFGTDMVDVYRNIKVQLKKTHGTEKIAGLWSDLWVPCIDGLQLQLDKRHLSSEVHLLLQKK